MAKIEVTIFRENMCGEEPLKVLFDGSLLKAKMILEIIEDGIEKCNEDIKDKYIIV
jgi:hypothetical protein